MSKRDEIKGIYLNLGQYQDSNIYSNKVLDVIKGKIVPFDEHLADTLKKNPNLDDEVKATDLNLGQDQDSNIYSNKVLDVITVPFYEHLADTQKKNPNLDDEVKATDDMSTNNYSEESSETAINESRFRKFRKRASNFQDKLEKTKNKIAVKIAQVKERLIHHPKTKKAFILVKKGLDKMEKHPKKR